MPLTITVKVVPNSGKNHCILDKSGKLKWYLKSVPEKGKANAELIKSVAQAANIPQTAVTIIAGATARSKTLKLDVDYSFETLLQLLGLNYTQLSLV